MKRTLIIATITAITLTLGNLTEVKAQSPTPMFIDNLITVNHRSPKPVDFKAIQKKIKKKKPNTKHLGTFECKSYEGYRSKTRTKRRNTVLKNRKKYTKRVLASRNY